MRFCQDFDSGMFQPLSQHDTLGLTNLVRPRVVYEDGDSEEYDSEEIENIVLKSDPAPHQSSSKDVGDDDKVAYAMKESEVWTMIMLETSPICPVKSVNPKRIVAKWPNLTRYLSQKVDQLNIKIWQANAISWLCKAPFIIELVGT